MMKRTWWAIVSNQRLSTYIVKCPEGCHLKKEGIKNSRVSRKYIKMECYGQKVRLSTLECNLSYQVFELSGLGQL